MKIKIPPKDSSSANIHFQKLIIKDKEHWNPKNLQRLTTSVQIDKFVKDMEKYNYNVEAYPIGITSKNGMETLHDNTKLNLRVVTKKRPVEEIYQFSSHSDFEHAVDIFSPTAVRNQVIFHKYYANKQQKNKIFIQREKEQKPSIKPSFLIEKILNKLQKNNILKKFII